VNDNGDVYYSEKVAGVVTSTKLSSHPEISDTNRHDIRIISKLTNNSIYIDGKFCGSATSSATFTPKTNLKLGFNSYNQTTYFYYPLVTVYHTPVLLAQSENFQDILAASATYIRAGEDVSAAVPITFTIDAQPDIPRTVSWAFVSHVNVNTYTMQITGTDAVGNSQTVSWTQASGWSGETNIAFATITSIKMTARDGTGVGDTMNVGIGSKIGLSTNSLSSVYKVKQNNADYPSASYTVSSIYNTVDVSTGGAITGGDDFTIWYKDYADNTFP
jgi:hypothetical protein